MGLVTVLLLFLAATLEARVLSQSKPNILLFIVDDLGHTDLSVHGAEYSTPNFDKLFSEGLNFTNYYVQLTCSPTRSAIMTGRYPFRLGLQPAGTIAAGSTAHIPLEEKTFAEQLKDLGYVNHYIGKWHLGYASKKYIPTGRGWDTYRGHFQGATDYYGQNMTANCGEKKTDKYNGYDFWNATSGNAPVPDWTARGTYSHLHFRDTVLEILDSKSPDDENPFSLTFAMQTVHAPIEHPPKELADRFKQCQDFKTTNELRRTYCEMLALADFTVGEIIEKLENRGLMDNTLILITTDNGGMPNTPPFDATVLAHGIGSNWPKRAGKATDFEGGVHGVAAISGGALPAKLRGKSIDTLHHAVDLPVTIMKAAGAVVPEKVDGVDVLAGESHDTIYIDIEWHSPKPSNIAIRDGDMKMVSHARKLYDGWWQYGVSETIKPDRKAGNCAFPDHCLFNLTADPNEFEDLSGSIQGKMQVMKLRKKIVDIVYGGDYHEAQATNKVEPEACVGTNEPSSNVWGPWLD